jgi:hypothetical protein
MLGLVKPIVAGPLVKDGRYPHMARRDAIVWERWLDQHGAEYQAVAYDVAVGGLAAPDAGASETDRRAWQYQTALKIDALVIAEDRALVIEVRPWATVSAFGSALAYSLVLDRASIADVVLVPTIVCEGIQVDVRWACEKLGVQIFEV